MKLKKYAYRCLAVVCAVVTVACVDDQYRLDEVNTEISVISEKTVLPVGTFEQKRLGEFMKDVELPEVVVRNEDGSYEVKYKIDTTISAGDFTLQSSFEILGAESSFPVSLPALNFDGKNFNFDTEPFSIPALDVIKEAIDEINSSPFGEVISGNKITIEERYFDYGFPSELSIDSGDEPVEIAIKPVEFDLPEQISDICSIIFAKEQEGDYGAPVELDIDLNGLAGINDGGQIAFALAPKGNIELELYNNVGERVQKQQDGTYVITQPIKQNAATVPFVLYLSKVNILPDANAESGSKKEIDLSMTCDFVFDLNLKAGDLLLTDEKGNDAEPTFAMSANIGFEDAEVKFNPDIDLLNFAFDSGFDFEINDLPEQLESINRITLKDTQLTLFASGFEWLANNAEAVSIDMTLPECLVLNKVDGMTYDYNPENHTLSMSIADISNEAGLILDFEAIDFGEGLKPENGAIAIKFAPEVRVHFSNSEQPISVMEFFPEDDSIEVVVGLKETNIGLESVEAQLAFAETFESEFSTGLSEVRENLGGLEIGGAGLSPVIMLSLSNPLTIAANVSASLVPMVDDQVQEDAIDFDVVIGAATYDKLTGETTPGVTTIVLAKPNREGDFPGSEFIGCDIDKLISTLPTDFVFNASFSLPNEAITLHMIDGLAMNVSVDLSLPIAFDDKLSIKYEDTISIVDEAGNSPIAEVLSSTEGIKVGDVALIAEIETNLPLELAASTVLLDKDGNELATKLGFDENNNKIQGSKDGKEAVKSTLRIIFELAAEDGSLAELKDIHSVKLAVSAKSVAEKVASLNDDQFIGATLKLEIDGGVTVDLSKLNE